MGILSTLSAGALRHLQYASLAFVIDELPMSYFIQNGTLYGIAGVLHVKQTEYK
jgi:hypothetical protein